MKKLFLLLTLSCLLLASCGEQAADTSTPAESASVQTSSEEAKQELSITLEEATEEQISDTENYTHVRDPRVAGASFHIVLRVTAPVEDFCFVALDEAYDLQLNGILQEVGTVTPDTPLIIHTKLNDATSNRGFSYTDEDGGTRYFAFTLSMNDGSVGFAEVTDRVTSPSLPEDLSTLFDETAEKYEDYERMDFTGWHVVHIYDWDQYFVINHAATITVTGNSALGFYPIYSGEDSHYNIGVYCFEKGREEAVFNMVPGEPVAIGKDGYTYEPLSEKEGYLKIFDASTDGNGERTPVQVHKTADGGLTWEQVEAEPPASDYASMKVLRTVRDDLLVLEDPAASASQRQVLVLKKNGLYTEIHRDYNLTTGYYDMSEAGILAFNNFEPEATAEAYVYNTSTGKLTKLDQSALPEDETISYMKWLDSDHLLLVSQLDHGTVVKGGELWCYDVDSKKTAKVVAVSDKRLQITDFEIHDLDDGDRLQVNAVYFDETYNFTEEKTYYIWASKINSILRYNDPAYTLLPDSKLHIRPSWEGEYHYYDNVTPDASVTNKYAVYSGTDLYKLEFCTFKAVGEDPAKGWLYEYVCTGSEYYLYANNPHYVQGSASYSITDTWGFLADGRFYAIMEDHLNGDDKLVDITDQVIGPDVPDDLSTVFDDTTEYHEGYREVVYNSFIVVHIYDWDQYFVLDTAMTLDIMGDTALGFAEHYTGLDSYYYKPMMYRFEKGKAEPTTAVIDVPEVHEAMYVYSPITEKMGYLMVCGILENMNGTEYLAQVLKTTDGGLTWEQAEMKNFPNGGSYHDPVYYSEFLTEDFGVISFLCNFDIDLAGQVHYTTNGGVNWYIMSGLDNLPRDPDEAWNLRNITLENGVYTITINAGYDQYIYFTSTDLENWEPVPQVVCDSVSETCAADFYDVKAQEKYGMYNAYFEILVTAPIKNVCFVELDESEHLQLGETLYTAGDLTPGTTVVIHTYLNDIHYNRGISYTDENGKTRYLALSVGDYGDIGVSEITFD